MARLEGYDPCPVGKEGVIDLGHDVRIRFTSVADRDAGGCLIATPQRAGLIESHPHPDGGRCSGHVTFDVPATADDTENPKWKILSEDPLTLDPSIQCRECPHHGHIQQGRWVPC